MNCNEWIADNWSHPFNKAVIITIYLLQFSVYANQPAVAIDCAVVVLLLYLNASHVAVVVVLAHGWNFQVAVKRLLHITSNQGPTEGVGVPTTRPSPSTSCQRTHSLFLTGVAARPGAPLGQNAVHWMHQHLLACCPSLAHRGLLLITGCCAARCAVKRRWWWWWWGRNSNQWTQSGGSVA